MTETKYKLLLQDAKDLRKMTLKLKEEIIHLQKEVKRLQQWKSFRTVGRC